ncbi:hypothetical protein [Aliiroseovarius sp. YM-037]|uniref:hypothetical protein n=1 Tax=Aliiroseovarius sp. YM-037 TaxID=3341728 RepID=UPI003A80CACE
MKTPIIALSIAALLLSACGSRLNPFNWFGRGQQEETLTVGADGEAAPRDARPLVSQVIDLQIDRTPGGAIIRAVGLPPTQGFFNAELIAENRERPDENGVLTYSFRLAEPFDFQRVSTQQSREVVVAREVSNIKLQGVRSIRVLGSQTSRISRR